MRRQTVLTIAILCGASAAAALAFVSKISRAGSHLVEGAASQGRGVTAAPASATTVHGDGRLVAAPDETPRAEYCRFPPTHASEAATAVPNDTLLGNPSGSTPLVLDGQSRVSEALPPALCAGDTVKSQRLGKP
jgi:hypothetical protein